MKNEQIKSFCEKNNIELLIIFGSQASGKITPASDIDVAVKLRKGTEASKLELIYQLDSLLNGKDIDLVILTDDTDPLLLYEIFLNGKLLYEKSPGIFDAERLRAWKLYIDTERLRMLQKKYLKKFVERVSNVA